VARTFAAYRLELWTARSVYPFMIVTLAVSCLVGGLNRRPEITGAVLMAFAMFLGGTIFQIHERNHSGKLYGFLPLRRREVVVGRYFYGLTVGLVNIVVAIVAVAVMNKVTGAAMSSLAFLVTLTAAWLFYCLAVSVSYPIYFAIDFSKAYIFTMLPFMVVMVAVIYIVRRGAASTVADAESFLDTHRTLLVLGGFGAGLVLLVVSSLISVALYQRRELV
jgi:hypothetical protein